MPMEIQLEQCRYAIEIENGLLEQIGRRLDDYSGQKIGVVTDATVWSLYGDRMLSQLQGRDITLTVLPPGESTKSFRSMERIFSEWIQGGMTRKDLALAFGGGVIGDLTGFAASTYLRGIDFIQVPTTLLSQLDSSIGGKVAIDLPEGKNLVGAFHHPKAVWMDPTLLETLTDRIFRDGLAEAIKAAAIADSDLFDRIERAGNRQGIQADILNILPASLTVKKTVVEVDEKEHGPRKLLNFGHTLGHAIEAHWNYERWTHGEAVAAGMSVATRASESVGLTEAGTSKRLTDLLEQFGLPTASDVPLGELTGRMLRDKKAAAGQLDLILIQKIGNGFIHKVPFTEIEEFYQKGV